MKELIRDKVLLFNTGALTITSFMELQEVLKIILLVISILYTALKMIKSFKEKDKDCEQK
jgi:hypothetical protein